MMSLVACLVITQLFFDYPTNVTNYYTGDNKHFEVMVKARRALV